MYNELEKYIKSNCNRVIAIDGPSGAGKSTLCRRLETEFDITVFHTDDYFLHSSKKTEKRLSEPGGNIDYERLELEIFTHLNSEKIQSNFFNCISNTLELRKPIKRKSIIVVEGVYSMHPRLIEYYDYKVFIDVNRDKQIDRILERNGKELLQRFINEWIPLEDKYFKAFRLRKNVDLYISNL